MTPDQKAILALTAENALLRDERDRAVDARARDAALWRLLREIREDAPHLGMPTDRIDAFLRPADTCPDNIAEEWHSYCDIRTCKTCREADGAADSASVIHASDCAVHNEPALPIGPCNCGAAP